MFQELWPGETTHRIDYSIPTEGCQKDKPKRHTSNLKFSGNMETTTTAMQDYQYPRIMVGLHNLSKLSFYIHEFKLFFCVNKLLLLRFYTTEIDSDKLESKQSLEIFGVIKKKYLLFRPLTLYTDVSQSR